MSKIEKGLVLDDDLFVEYHKFRNGKECDTDTIMKLLHFFQNPLVTNYSQYNRTGIEMPQNLKGQLAHHPLKSADILTLSAKGTLHKIILTKTSTGFPYLNITDPKNFECNITASYAINEPRHLALQHLKAMCADAKLIMVCDKYLNNKSAANTLKEILPRHKLIIEYLEMDKEKVLDPLKSICAEWEFKQNPHMSGYHDRYLIIDSQLEIILTSGFDNLWDRNIDFSYIVRPVEASRFKTATRQ